VENFQNFFNSVDKVWLRSETFSQDHKEVSEVVGKRLQITVTSIHWLYCEIIESERIVDQFSEISKLEVFFPCLYIGFFQHEELPAIAYEVLLKQYG
jgi:hypothetical protein